MQIIASTGLAAMLTPCKNWPVKQKFVSSSQSCLNSSYYTHKNCAITIIFIVKVNAEVKVIKIKGMFESIKRG